MKHKQSFGTNLSCKFKRNIFQIHKLIQKISVNLDGSVENVQMKGSKETLKVKVTMDPMDKEKKDVMILGIILILIFAYISMVVYNWLYKVEPDQLNQEKFAPLDDLYDQFVLQKNSENSEPPETTTLSWYEVWKL